MSLIIANTSFATAYASFEQDEVYDSAVREVSLAVLQAPGNFRGYPTTCVRTFAAYDPANPGTARIIRQGDVLMPDDPAVTASFGNFA